MKRNSIFLSGWEYNRILQNRPTASRQSALPAESLWNGGAQFWLFENVYCTEESLKGEIAASETLGWATGNIFQDLIKRGFLKTYKWENLKKDDPLKHEELVDSHKSLRSIYNEKSILNLLGSGNSSELESIKLKLLKPILNQLNCISNISPNSIRQWVPSKLKDTKTSTSQALDHLSKPLEEESGLFRAGIKLCNPPGTGVNKIDIEAQKYVETTIQKPMIPDLLSGRLSQKDYMDALIPTASVYKPINTQLQRDYEDNIEKLMHLRDIACKYLWKNLHEEWIPELEQNPEFLSEFNRRLRFALNRARLDPYLQYASFIAIAILAISIGSVASSIAPSIGLPPLETHLVTGLVADKIISSTYEEKRKKSDELTIFFQKARHK